MSLSPISLVMPRPWSDKPQPTRRELLWIAEGKHCHWCGRETRLVYGDAADQATIDHILPRYKGGTNDVSNLVSSCRGCNARRNTEDMKGLKDGSLLRGNGKSQKYVALTGDEKKAILAKVQATPVKMRDMAKTEDVLREQRDQAQKRIIELQREMKHWEATVTALQAELKELKSMTMMRFVRKRLAERLLS